MTPDFNQATPTGKTDLLPRTQEGGLIKGRVVVPNIQNENAGAALASIDGYNPKATALEKSQLVSQEISNEATGLKTQLENSKVILPKREIVGIVKNATDKVSENSLVLQNSDPIIQKYINLTQRTVNQSDGTLAGVLDVRKALDAAYSDARGKLAFGSDRLSALDEIHTAARTALNDFLIKNAPNSNVKLSFQYQKALYDAQDELQKKAIKEGITALARVKAAIHAHPLGALIASGVGTLVGGEIIRKTTGL